jgi:hypothetical protein
VAASDKLPTYADIADKPLSEIIAKVRLFNPTGSGTWFIAAYDPDTGIAWGGVDMQTRDIGSFSMTELVDFRGRFGLPIERDLHYQGKTTMADLAAHLDLI